MKKILSIASLAISLTCVGVASQSYAQTAPAPQTMPAATNPELEKAAKAIVEPWAALIDGGKYQDAWSQSAKVVKDKVDAKTFEASIKTVRDPLGKLTSRTFNRSMASQVLPGAPKGDYVILEYKAVYEKQPSVMETYVLQKEADGQWRVAGYRMR